MNSSLIKNFLLLLLGCLVVLILAAIMIHKHLAKSSITSQPPQDNSISIISTSPSPLNESTILPTQSISLTFSQPVLNEPELKIRVDPPVDFKLKLSSYNETVTISFPEPLSLGQGYTLFLPAGAKFQGGKTLGEDHSYHFSTVSYQGV